MSRDAHTEAVSPAALAQQSVSELRQAGMKLVATEDLADWDHAGLALRAGACDEIRAAAARGMSVAELAAATGQSIARIEALLPTPVRPVG